VSSTSIVPTTEKLLERGLGDEIERKWRGTCMAGTGCILEGSLFVQAIKDLLVIVQFVGKAIHLLLFVESIAGDIV